MSCCDLSASHCARFHSPHSGCQLISQRRRGSTPDKSHCLSLSVTQRQILPQPGDGMLLQDIFKRLAVDWMTVRVSYPFVLPPTVPQAVLPPAGPACTFGSVGLRVSGRVAEDHQDGALRRQFPAGWPQHSGSAGPDQHTVRFCFSRFLSVSANYYLGAFNFYLFQGSAAHGSDSGRTPEEDPFQHPDHELSQQEHHHCDLLNRLPAHADMNCSTRACASESTLNPLLTTDSKRDRKNVCMIGRNCKNKI